MLKTFRNRCWAINVDNQKLVNIKRPLITPRNVKGKCGNPGIICSKVHQWMVVGAFFSATIISLLADFHSTKIIADIVPR